MQPNIPIEYSTLRAYIEAIAGTSTATLAVTVSANQATVMALINDLQTSIADIESLNANISANADVVANTAHRQTISGNPHHVTKAEIGLSQVPNYDFTAEMAINNAKVGITQDQADAIVVNTAKVGISVQQAADIVSNNIHRAIASGNPHNVTKAEVGLGNVPNIDCTDASNITTGTLPTSVLPALAITDSYSVDNEAEQLALDIQKGDVAVRTDINRSYINKTGGNSAMSDWQEILTPTDTILSVNGQTGAVILTTTNIEEGTNFYYTEERVSNNIDVATNTANRHAHGNKAVLDDITSAFTTEKQAELDLNTAHRTTTSGNPHDVTKADIGLSNVPNHDFTDEVAANTAKVGITTQQTADIVAANVHRLTTSGNPHNVTKVEIGLGNVPNTDFTEDVLAANSHIATVIGNPHNVTKADVGLSNVPNHDFTAEVAANTAKTGITQEQADAIVANTAKVGITTEQAADIESNNAHRLTTSGNPHNVTKAEVGLGNVPNVDCTDASNITTGTLPTSVLPALAISETYIVADETAQLALTVQKGDVAVRIDENRSYINTTGVNTAMSDWQELLTPTDTILSVNGQTGVVVLTTTNIAEGTNLYYTEERVSANNDVAANTANRHNHSNKAVLDGTEESFTSVLKGNILANNEKVGITTEQADAIVANTAKVGITAQQTADIISNNTHRAITSGNPHNVTKTEIGLGNVPNTDFTTNVANADAHIAIITGNPHHVTKGEVGLGNVPNHDFTAEVTANTVHAAIISGNPHNVTKEEIGLGLVPNHDFTDEVAANTAKVGITPEQTQDILDANAHIATTSGNPHNVTKAEVGLGNVPNVDCTNASNITTGVLPSSVLPAIAITDVYTVDSESEQLALDVQRGDVVVRTDLNRSFINRLSANDDMSDWQELLTPTDVVLSVNGQTGTVILTTSNVAEGSNLYYTEDRVSANINVATNTANRHAHGNKTILDETTASFTTALEATIGLNNTHRLTTSGNPHNVTKAEVGLGNVPNYDFTAEMAINNDKVGITPEQAEDIVNANLHIATVIGNPHNVTKADVGLGDVPNTDFTVNVANADAHIATISGNPHNVTKDEIGLGLVPNHDFTAEVAANTAKTGITQEQADAIVANTAKVGITTEQTQDILNANAHIATVSGNPHNVTKAEVGLGNVPNVDCTDASNITTGILPTSVLPALAISETYTVADETAQLALTVQKGDVAVRTDENRSYINVTGNNTAMSDWQELLTPTDTILSINGQTGVVVLTTTNIAEGTNLYYTEERVSANSDVAANTANRHNHANKTILDGTEESFTTVLRNNIITNNDKVGITTEQADAIVANTAKVGITTEQTQDILNANAHIATTSGNPHNITKAEIGLGQVPNTDFTDAVAANTAHRGILIGNPHNVTKADVGLGDVPNHDFTAEVNANTVHAAIISGNPHNVTKEEVGLGSVPNHDFTEEVAANTAKVGITPEQTAAIIANTAHSEIVAGNPHHVTKAEVGLGNVPNVDCTNASNITTGTLPTNVLPALAITETYVAANQLEQLSLIVEEGDIAVRTDLNRTYINVTGVNNTMSDWQELLTPTDTILSVNGQTGTVILTTTNIAEGTNLYYTEERVSANSDVAANTANRHNHANKDILDATTASYTTSDVDTLASVNTHRLTTSGNPHNVTKAEVGLGNVPNINFTADISASNTHITTVTGNPHNVTKDDVGLGNVPNHDFTDEVAANTAKVGITTEQANAIVINSAKVGITAQQASDIESNNAHRNITSGNPHNVTKAEVGLGSVPNHDFTDEVAANTAKVGITTQQAADIESNNAHRAIITGNPHNVTKDEVGLGNVPNTNFTINVANADAHIATTSGNPHNVTKVEVGLGNVPNVDCTNASNITTGVLPSSVLPALAITDTFIAADETAQLALTVQKGDVAVRTDENRSYINVTGVNTAMSDWQELLTPTDTILSVNGQTGIVVLTTTNIAEGTNLYYTEERVSANSDVAANTANRHNHDNKEILDATNESFTTAVVTQINANTAKVGITVQQASDIEANNSHRLTTLGNPHNVTKAEIGLGNVPNLDFTSAVAANTAHANTVSGNPHNVTKGEIGLGNVPNTDFTVNVANADAHIATTSGNPHHVTKDEVGLGNVPNHDFTDEVAANTAKVGITTQQAADIESNNAHRLTTAGNPHAVNKDDVGLGNVPNVDFTEEINLNTINRHSHSNKPVLDATTSAFTTEQADEIVACHSHRLDTSTNPHGITPVMIGAETPAGAQSKADTAEHNANLYTDSFVLQSPSALLFEAAFRNSLAIDKGVGIVNFTRASEGNHLDRYDIVRKSGVNTPRFNKSGFLIEGRSTNYFIGSKDASQFTTTNCRVELNKQYDASFEATVDIISIDVPASPWKLTKVIEDMYLEEGGYITFSVRLKSLTETRIALSIQDSSGTISGNIATPKEIVLNEYLTRYEYTVQVNDATVGHPVITIEGLTSTEGESFALVDMQVESLPFASSVIETSATVVTREPDRASIPYVENFPGSLKAKTVAIDVDVIGTTNEIHRCFCSGDLQLYVGNGTVGNRMTRVGMSSGQETDWVEKQGKFRFGATYDPTTKELCMYHDGIKVATKTNVTKADSILTSVESYDQFLSEIYPTIDPTQNSALILQIPTDVMTSEIRFDCGNPFIAISNIRIADVCLTEKQMLTF